jgi:hypothetical protein
LDDLPSLDPALHRSLGQVLRYDGDVVGLCSHVECSCPTA